METVPTEEDWGDYDSDRIEDLDLQYAHDVFIGKTNEEMLASYKDHVLMKVEDLHWWPKKPFQYCIFGVRDCFIRRNFGFYESSVAASSFLRLVLLKLKQQPDHILTVWPMLMPDIEFVVNIQSLYDADVDIYGGFMELLNQLRELHNGA